MRDTVNDFPEDYKTDIESRLSLVAKALGYIPWTTQLCTSILEKINLIQRDRAVLIENKGRMLRWICWNERYRTWIDQSYNDFYLSSVQGVDALRKRLEEQKVSQKI